MEEFKPQDISNESTERVFKVQDVVKVKRSSGEMEDGWFVFIIDGDRAMVVNKDGKNKKVPLSDLREWNR